MKGRIKIALFGVFWLAALAFGMWKLVDFSTHPAETAAIAVHWPSQSSIERSASTPTLLMFTHPLCSCSKASMGELDHLMAQITKPLHAVVVFVTPKHPGPMWQSSALLHDAKSIAGVKTFIDEGGVIADLFAAKTSGQVVLYDEAGALAFSGGITGARGHFGDNIGEQSIVSFVNNGTLTQKHTAVFGCSLKENHMESMQ